VFAATSLQTLVQMVGSGLGVGFLPEMAVRAGLADGSEVKVVPLDAEAPRREIVVAWRAGSSRAREGRLLAEAFRDTQPVNSNSAMPGTSTSKRNTPPA
jgi:LysR family hydrogen peroxide-inducible transcriptional activator